MFALLVPLLVACAFIKIYLLIRKRNNYWKDRGVPTIETNFVFGTTYDLLLGRRSFGQVYERIYAAGDEPYVGIQDGTKPVLFIRDPELIHQITVKDFNHFHARQRPLNGGGRLARNVAGLQGDEWRTMRHKIVPTFSGSKLKKMYGLMEECAETLLEHHFGPSSRTREPVEVAELLDRYSLDVLGKCVFGLQFNSIQESDSLYQRIGQAFSAAGFKNTVRLIITMINPTLLGYFGIKVTTDEVENFFFDLLHGAEELRRKETEHRGDFLQLMLDLKNESNNEAEHLFTEEHIAGNMYMFYLAGHEPTSLAIAFTLYELAKNPEVQEKLRAEVVEAREANNGTLDYQTVKKLPYLQMVLAEALRLHPTASYGIRMCTENYQAPGSSLRIEAGQMVLFCMSGMQRDEKYFPNPMKFDPERFSAENLPLMNPLTYLPWGKGPRMCLGLRFAKLEMKICLASVVSRFKLTCCAKTEDPIILKTENALFRAPKNGIWLSVEEI